MKEFYTEFVSIDSWIHIKSYKFTTTTIKIGEV